MIGWLVDWWRQRHGWTVFRCPECHTLIAWKTTDELVNARMSRWVRDHSEKEGLV